MKVFSVIFALCATGALSITVPGDTGISSQGHVLAFASCCPSTDGGITNGCARALNFDLDLWPEGVCCSDMGFDYPKTSNAGELACQSDKDCEGLTSRTSANDCDENNGMCAGFTCDRGTETETGTGDGAGSGVIVGPGDGAGSGVITPPIIPPDGSGSGSGSGHWADPCIDSCGTPEDPTTCASKCWHVCNAFEEKFNVDHCHWCAINYWRPNNDFKGCRDCAVCWNDEPTLPTWKQPKTIPDPCAGPCGHETFPPKKGTCAFECWDVCHPGNLLYDPDQCKICAQRAMKLEPPLCEACWECWNPTLIVPKDPTGTSVPCNHHECDQWTCNAGPFAPDWCKCWLESKEHIYAFQGCVGDNTCICDEPIFAPIPIPRVIDTHFV